MSKINEEQLGKADITAVFKAAVEKSNNPSLFGKAKAIAGFRKPVIQLSDLQTAWANEGYSDDIRDINRILLDHGFSKKDIQTIYSNILGDEIAGEDDYDDENTVQNKAIQRIADYAKKNDMAAELIAFLKKEYKFTDITESYRKVSIEEVRQIFTNMIPMDRSNRYTLMQEDDEQTLGRKRK